MHGRRHKVWKGQRRIHRKEYIERRDMGIEKIKGVNREGERKVEETTGRTLARE
jgi:hypothetical protein